MESQEILSLAQVKFAWNHVLLVNSCLMRLSMESFTHIANHVPLTAQSVPQQDVLNVQLLRFYIKEDALLLVLQEVLNRLSMVSHNADPALLIVRLVPQMQLLMDVLHVRLLSHFNMLIQQQLVNSHVILNVQNPLSDNPQLQIFVMILAQLALDLEQLIELATIAQLRLQDVIHVQTQMEHGHALNATLDSTQTLRKQFATLHVQQVQFLTQQQVFAPLAQAHVPLVL